MLRNFTFKTEAKSPIFVPLGNEGESGGDSERQPGQPDVQSSDTLTPDPNIRIPRSSRKDVDYKLLGNPAARKPGARHIQTDPISASTPELNKEALTAIIFHVLHGDLNLDEAPSTLEEAKKCPDWNNWFSAMEEEIRTLRKMNTWELTSLPKNRNPISC